MRIKEFILCGLNTECMYSTKLKKLLGGSSPVVVACVAGGIRGHERMGSLKYRLPKNDTF
jgi:hypothetical protein